MSSPYLYASLIFLQHFFAEIFLRRKTNSRVATHRASSSHDVAHRACATCARRAARRFSRARSSCRRQASRAAARRARRRRTARPRRGLQAAQVARIVARRTARTSVGAGAAARRRACAARFRPHAPPRMDRIEAVPRNFPGKNRGFSLRGELRPAPRSARSARLSNSLARQPATAETRTLATRDSAPRRRAAATPSGTLLSTTSRAVRCESIERRLNPVDDRLDRRFVRQIVADVGDDRDRRRGVRAIERIP